MFLNTFTSFQCSAHKYVVVNLVYTDGKEHYPIDYRIYAHAHQRDCQQTSQGKPCCLIAGMPRETT